MFIVSVHFFLHIIWPTPSTPLPVDIAMTDISPQICLQIHRVPLEPAIGKFRNSLRLVTVQASTDSQETKKLSSEDSDSTESDSSRDSILREEQDVDEGTNCPSMVYQGG